MEVSKREVASKVRKIGEYSMLIQNHYVLLLFYLTAEDTINRGRFARALREMRSSAKTLLDLIDELLRELGETGEQ